MVICLQWVDDDLEASVDFYNVDSTEASTLLTVIQDVLLQMNLTNTKVQGRCYDGAAAMSGPRGGVATN